MNSIAHVKLNEVAVDQMRKLRRRRRALGIPLIDVAFNVPMSRFRMTQAEKERIALSQEEIRKIEETIDLLEKKRAQSVELSTASAIA